MEFQVENLVVAELGSEFIGEADFQGHRISVRCEHDSQHGCWVYRVFLIDGLEMRPVFSSQVRMRSNSRLEAISLGMRHAVKAIHRIA